jgi:cell division septation protein DedD
VPELSHDTAEDGFHEIQLSGKQLVFLFIVTTSVLVGVFLCGVLVGRGARGVGGEEPEALAAAATAPAPQPVADGGPPAAEPPAPAAETPDELSYHKRLQSAEPAPETIKPQAEAETPPAPPPADPPPPAARPTAPQAADVPATGRPGTWVVQVIATRDPAVATSVVKQLAGKGYPAFLVNPAAGAAQPFYKVHVGRYNDRREAEQVSSRIKKEEQFQPWISR